MKRKNIILIIAGILILSTVFFSINFNKQELDPNYSAGEIIIALQDATTRAQAEELINKYNLTTSFFAWSETVYVILDYLPDVSAEEGWNQRAEMASLIDDQDSENLIAWTEVYSDTIRVQSEENVTEHELTEFLSQFEVEINETHPSSNFLLVKVPEGEEKKWIKILEKEEIVQYAEHNYYETITG